MGEIAPVDLWHVKTPKPGARPCVEHAQNKQELYPSSKHGKGNRWAARYRDHRGKQHSPTFKRASDAKNHLIKALADSSRGAYIDPKAGKVRFEDYSTRWLDRQTFDVTTREGVERNIRLHLVPTLGEHELRRIKPPEVQGLIRSLQHSLQAGTIIVVVGWLSAILDAAVDDDLIDANPCRAKSVKRPSPPVRKVVPWESEQTDKIRRAIAAKRPFVAETVTAGEGLGMRVGEVLGFSPDDIDWLRGVVHIRRQIRIARGKAVFARPKGDKERDVPLAATVSLRLARHIELHPPRSVTLPWGDVGGKPVTVDLMFTTKTGRPWWRNHFGTWVWEPAIKSVGLPPVPQVNGFHQLRHRFASVVLAGGATIRDLADWLGHENPAFTLRVYSHLMPASAEKMKAAIDAAFASLNDSGGAPDVRQASS